MRQILDTKEEIRLYTVHEILNEDGQLAKTMYVPQWFRKDGITSVSQHVTDRNTLSKRRCVIHDKYSGRFYGVAHNMDDIAKRVFNHITRTQQIGFTYDTNLHTREPQISELRARRD